MPSPRQRGCDPPTTETYHYLRGPLGGKGRMKTSVLPDSFESYATHCESGDTWHLGGFGGGDWNRIAIVSGSRG